MLDSILSRSNLPALSDCGETHNSHVTRSGLNRANNGTKEEKPKVRAFWSVAFIDRHPPGTVESPPGPVLLVYVDTGKVEFFDSL